jgi:hypothetical protein
MLQFLLFAVVAATEYPEERGVIIVTERTYWAAMIEFRNILYFYHNSNYSESTAFRSDFIANASRIRKVNSTIKLAVFDIDVTMETAKKLELKLYPTLRLFINKTLASDSNSSITRVRTSDDVIVWYHNAIAQHTVDFEER